jgi:hypothetical protein
MKVPRNMGGSSRCLALFGAMGGRHYGDNGAALYEWTLRHRPDIEALWITKDRGVYQDLRKRDYPVTLARSVRGVRALRRADVALFTNNLGDISAHRSMVPESLPLIALRH